MKDEGQTLKGLKAIKAWRLETAMPPKVEYGLTDWGQALCPALDALLKWAALRGEMDEGTSAASNA